MFTQNITRIVLNVRLKPTVMRTKDLLYYTYRYIVDIEEILTQSTVSFIGDKFFFLTCRIRFYRR